MNDTIKFYSHRRGKYSMFSNFSPHPVIIDGLEFPTTEHYFQALKFPSHPEYQETIRRSSTPGKAKRLGSTRSIPLRSDWEEIKEEVMMKALRAKAEQHPRFRSLLLLTADSILVEDSPYDYYWGCGRSGKGKNRLGVLLMRLRSELSF